MDFPLEDKLRELRDLIAKAHGPDVREWAPATFHWVLLRAFGVLRDWAKEQGPRFWARPSIEFQVRFGWDRSVPRVVLVHTNPNALGSSSEPPIVHEIEVKKPGTYSKEDLFSAMVAIAVNGLAPPGYRLDLGDRYAIHIPQHVKDELDGLPPEEREAAGWKKLEPFRMGAREFRPKAAYPDPPTIEALPPPVYMREKEGPATCYELATFVELGQLVVEKDEKHAFFPLNVGLALSPGSLPFSSWPERERSEFWPSILAALERSVRATIHIVANADNVPVTPDAATAKKLEPFFRVNAELSFASSSVLSDESGVIRLAEPPSVETAAEPPILLGLALSDAKPGETANVATYGDALFLAQDPQLKTGMANAGAIVHAARAFGVEVPENFVFSAGQLFYKNKKLVEVRLSGLVNPRLREDGQMEATPWSTPNAPSLTADEKGVLSLAPEDKAWTHLSAMVVRTTDQPLAISLLWDLRENVPTPPTLPKEEPIGPDLPLALVEESPTKEDTSEPDFTRALAKEKPVEKRVFPLAFGSTLADTSALLFVSHVHKIRFPAKKWSTLPSWPDLTSREVDRLREKHGEDAFKDSGERGPLLKKRTNARGEPVLALTAEAERELKKREGLAGGFRYLDPTNGREYFMRLFEAGSGFIEVGLSWFGLAGPWVEEWRRELRKQTQASVSQQLGLFEDIPEEERARINRLIARMRLLDDGQRIMEAVLGQIGRQGRNPVEVPALTFRVLLQIENDPHWKARVEGALEALRACEFKLDTFGRQKEKAYGSFLGEWRYSAAGAGAHGDGTYSLFVLPGFLGCLSSFESQKRKLRDGREVTHYEFNRKLGPEEKKALGWGPKAETSEPETFVHFDAGRAFYNAAAGLSHEQENLLAFLEQQITPCKSAVSRTLGTYATRKKLQATKGADANLPRVYSAAECPLLLEGVRYHAALGNFRRNAEAGWRLGGTPRREGETGGAHHGGLVHQAGYHYPAGSATAERAKVVRKTLEDLKAVVVEYFGGVVAVRMKDGSWLPLEKASKLQERELVERANFFLFVPEDWTSKRKAKWEEQQEGRARRGETPYAWIATESTEVAGAARASLAGVDDLHRRLRIVRKERGLTQAAVGDLFGVSQKTIALWEQGDVADEDGNVRGKPISKDLRPLVERWLESGTAPAIDELENRRNGTV